jgi:hypothetical protein
MGYGVFSLLEKAKKAGSQAIFLLTQKYGKDRNNGETKG